MLPSPNDYYTNIKVYSGVYSLTGGLIHFDHFVIDQLMACIWDN